jgi:hypothetical protein
MIKVDGVEYTAKEAEHAIRELRSKVKELMGPFTCGHNPEYAGGACAACHAIWIDAEEKAQKRADVCHQQLAALLDQAMKRICEEARCQHGPDCVGGAFGKKVKAELDFRYFVGKLPTDCPACSGSGEFGLSDGSVPCLSCCGSGERSRKGPFYQKDPKCGKCGKKDATVTFATFLKKPEWPYLCHKCDRLE